MIFSDITFYIFFSIVFLSTIIIDFLIPKFQKDKNSINKYRQILLLIASYIFYGWWDWRFCFLMFFITLITYVTSLLVDNTKYRKLAVKIGVLFPLIILFIFKYFNFFVDSFDTVFKLENTNLINIILPVGISFYTFQALSYTLDVYHKKITAEKKFYKVSLYISFFPQLVAGPIVKSKDFMYQLNENKRINSIDTKNGIQIFIFGLFKKIVIADNISPFVDEIYNNPGIFNWTTLLLAIIAYSIQIYMDFSGYSDMAIGSAKILGYDLKRNFNLPYISKNVSEFWKRWHISLSSWLQEYLYFSLGGNRKGTLITYFNLIVTMLLGGLWHGANWTFVMWGFLHGMALCIHKLWKKNIKSSDKTIYKIVSIFSTYIFVSFCWIFFRADSFSKANLIIKNIISLSPGVKHYYIPALVSIVLIIFATIAAYIKNYRCNTGKKQFVITGFYPILNFNSCFQLSLFFIIIGIIIGLAFTGSSPFIYFQF